MAAAGRRWVAELVRRAPVVVDTNVLIYHLEGLSRYLDLTARLISALAEAETRAIVSTVTLAEVLAGPYRSGDPSAVDAARAFVEDLPNTVLADVTPPIADRAAWLRPQGFRMPDALIMATAIVHSAGAVVTNDPGLGCDHPDLPIVLLLDDFVAGP